MLYLYIIIIFEKDSHGKACSPKWQKSLEGKNEDSRRWKFIKCRARMANNMSTLLPMDLKE